MNQIQQSKQQLISFVKLAPNWEIRDVNFHSVIASSDNGTNLEDAINEIQEKYAGYNLILKAGKKDGRGIFGSQTKTISFMLPAVSDTENYNVEIIQNSNQNNLSGFGGFNQQSQQPSTHIYDLILNDKIKNLDGLFSAQVEKLEAQNVKTLGEIENKYRAQILDMREAQIQQKEAELREREYKLQDDEAESVKRILPKGKALLDGLINLFSNNVDKKTLGSTPLKTTNEDEEFEDEDFEDEDVTPISKEESTNIDNFIKKMTTEQKDILLDRLTNDITEDENETQNITE